jgi:hypothetical protein
MPITISELADHRLRRHASTGQDFIDAELPITGGCEVCGASIAAYNACPSTSGYLRCSHGCIGDDGFDTVEAAAASIFAGDDDDDDDDLCVCGHPRERHADPDTAATRAAWWSPRAPTWSTVFDDGRHGELAYCACLRFDDAASAPVQPRPRSPTTRSPSTFSPTATPRC